MVTEERLQNFRSHSADVSYRIVSYRDVVAVGREQQSMLASRAHGPFDKVKKMIKDMIVTRDLRNPRETSAVFCSLAEFRHLALPADFSVLFLGCGWFSAFFLHRRHCVGWRRVVNLPGHSLHMTCQDRERAVGREKR